MNRRARRHAPGLHAPPWHIPLLPARFLPTSLRRAPRLLVPLLLLAAAAAATAQEPPEPFRLSPTLQGWAAQRIGPDDADLLRELTAVADRAAAIRFFHRFAQQQLEAHAGDGWVYTLLASPLRDEVAPLGADLYPREVRLMRIVTKDGKTLTGAPSPLGPRFAPNDPRLARGIGDQFTLGLGRGVPELSYGLWVDAEDLRSHAEVAVPAPGLFLGVIHARTPEPDGTLRIDASAVVPPGPPRDESLVLEPRYVESGGALFLHESLGVELWTLPPRAPEERRWWLAARRRAERDRPEAALNAARLGLDLRFLAAAREQLDAAAAEPRTAAAAARLEPEWTRLRTEELLRPARDAAARGELDAALRALSDLPEPGRKAADALADELEPKLDAVAAFLEAFRSARDAVPEERRPAWAAVVPAPSALDPERCAAARDPQEDDPLRRLHLLRVRYHYGTIAPAPESVAALEDAARVFLAAEGKEEAAAVKTLLAAADAAKARPQDVLRIVQRVPWLDPPPGPGRIDFPHPTRGTHHACVAFPPGYGPWKPVPVYVTHHGQGGDAEEWLEATLRTDVPAHALGMAVVCPAYGSGQGVGRALADDADTMALLRFLRLRTNVDPDRFYVAGCSMGGAQSWHLAETYTDAWAAAAPDARAPTAPLLPTLLRNLATLPIWHVQGAFNGRSVPISREAVARLTAWKGEIVYQELGMFGHDAAWRQYPDILRWMRSHSRPPAPAEIYLGACKAYAAERAWLRIRSLRRPVAWAKTDGAYSPGDLVALSARVRDGGIELEAEADDRARLREIEIFLDETLLGEAEEVPIRFRRKTVAVWRPERKLERALTEIKRRGDRTRAYRASIVLEVTGDGFRAK